MGASHSWFLSRPLQIGKIGRDRPYLVGAKAVASNQLVYYNEDVVPGYGDHGLRPKESAPSEEGSPLITTVNDARVLSDSIANVVEERLELVHRP